MDLRTAFPWDHEAAAVSEGYCPRCAARLIPVPSAAKAAGHCEVHGYWWAGGPDTEDAAQGWVSDPAGLP